MVATKTRMTGSEYARHAAARLGRNVSQQAISAAIKRGAIPVDRAGKVKVKEADESWVPSDRGRPAGTNAHTGLDPAVPSPARSNQILKAAQARRAQLDLQAREGELVERQVAVEFCGRICERLRDGLVAIIDRHETRCPGLRTDIAALLDRVADEAKGWDAPPASEHG